MQALKARLEAEDHAALSGSASASGAGNSLGANDHGKGVDGAAAKAALEAAEATQIHSDAPALEPWAPEPVEPRRQRGGDRTVGCRD